MLPAQKSHKQAMPRDDNRRRASVRRTVFAVMVIGLLPLLISCAAGTGDKEKEKKNAALPPVQFTAQVDKATATVGDIVTLTLTVNCDPQLSVEPPDAGSQIAGLRIIDAGEQGPKLVDTRTVHTKWYKLQPDIVGSYIIPPLTVSYADQKGAQKELQSPQIFIEVKSVLKDKQAGAATDIIDIKPLQDVPRPLGPLLMYGGAALLFFLAAGAALWLYLRRKKKLAAAPAKPAHLLAFEELEQLTRDQLIEKGIVREYYFRLSEIFRRYIERRFHIPAVERTTEELVPDILNRTEFGSAVKAETREILRYADLVKFARFSPDKNTTDNEYRKVVHVIEETKEMPAPDNAQQSGSASAPSLNK